MPMDSHIYFYHSMHKNNMDRDSKKIKFIQILPHVCVDLDMAGEHLNIKRILKSTFSFIASRII